MGEVIYSSGATRILYDATRMVPDGADWLLPDRWQANGAVVGTLPGRGTAWRVETGAGPAVLRRFRRGGQVARLVYDRYFFTGWERSRAFREWRALLDMHLRGLPVPRPLAASCERTGIGYRAGLLTAFIPDTRVLADCLRSNEAIDWHAIGATIHRFCAAGVRHADLNARNILLDGAGRVWLVDFDRARQHDRPVSGRPMLSRLRRSLDKFDPSAADTGWAELLRGFNECV